MGNLQGTELEFVPLRIYPECMFLSTNYFSFKEAQIRFRENPQLTISERAFENDDFTGMGKIFGNFCSLYPFFMKYILKVILFIGYTFSCRCLFFSGKCFLLQFCQRMAYSTSSILNIITPFQNLKLVNCLANIMLPIMYACYATSVFITLPYGSRRFCYQFFGSLT